MRFLVHGFRAMAFAGAALALVACGGGGGDSHGAGNGGGGAGEGPRQEPTSAADRLNEPNCALAYYGGTETPPATGADPLLPTQWHLLNTGQSGGTPGEDIRVSDAWQTTNGSGVRVAIVDSGIEIVHDDLAPNVVTGASFNFQPGDRFGSAYPLPCDAGEVHGTAVAGIVAARGGNAIGGAGVAPAASLVGLNPLATNLDADIAQALLHDNAVNAIYQNSWGSPDWGSLFRADSTFVDAIEQGLVQGRGGLGSIFVFSAGNGGAWGDNANFDGYVNKRGLITVCAVDDNGVRPWYGETGANVLVCAPSSNTRSAITTTSLDESYMNGFTGTSASAPMVSGTVALMLQANPALSWRDVQLILASTARRNSPTDPGWVDASGLHYHPEFGFGTVDASAAVAAARNWTTVGGSAEQKSCVSAVRNPNIPIADNSVALAAFDSVTFPGCDIEAIEFVEVTFTAEHMYPGDLRVTLTSPNGLRSLLANERGQCARNWHEPDSVPRIDQFCGNYNNWQFGSVRHLNEPSSGTWTLHVADVQPRDTGVFRRWQVRIWGR